MSRFAPLLALCLLAGCDVKRKVSATDADKAAALNAAAARIGDPNALMTDWYRQTLKPVAEVSRNDETRGFIFTTTTTVESVTPALDLSMMWSAVYLGLLVYPAVLILVMVVEINRENGSLRADYEQAAAKDEQGYMIGGLLVAGTAAAYLLAVFLAGVVAVGSVALCPLLVRPNAYIPFHYAFFLSQCLLMLAVVLFVGLAYVVAPVFGAVSAGRSAARYPEATDDRTRRLIRAAVKALLVAVLTALGNQLGGWIGGVIALVVAGVLAALFEPPPPPAP